MTIFSNVKDAFVLKLKKKYIADNLHIHKPVPSANFYVQDKK